MPYVEAAILIPWKEIGGEFQQPAVIDDIHNWAQANSEWLSTFEVRGVTHHTTYKCEDKTGQLRATLLDGKVFAALLTVNLATAQHFQSDPRMFRLGWKVFSDDGELQSSNWGETLDAASRTQALDWLKANGYTRAQVAARFKAIDTRQEILDKLRALFRE